MAPRPFNDRTVGHKWAVAQRPDKADRLVLKCVACPPSRRSRRTVPSWARVAAAVAAAVGADPGEVRVALDEALAREKNGTAGGDGASPLIHGAAVSTEYHTTPQ